MPCRGICYWTYAFVLSLFLDLYLSRLLTINIYPGWRVGWFLLLLCSSLWLCLCYDTSISNRSRWWNSNGHTISRWYITFCPYDTKSLGTTVFVPMSMGKDNSLPSTKNYQEISMSYNGPSFWAYILNNMTCIYWCKKHFLDDLNFSALLRQRLKH